MIRSFMLFAAALSLVACGPTVTAPPGSAGSAPAASAPMDADTGLDERIVIGVETAYTAAAKAATVAIRTKLVTDKAKIARIGELDRAAYAAVQATRVAYRVGNGTAYDSKYSIADRAVKALLAAF